MLFTCALVFVLPGYIFAQNLPLLDSNLNSDGSIAGRSQSQVDEVDSTIVFGPDISLRTAKYRIWKKPEDFWEAYYNEEGKEPSVACDEGKPIHCSRRKAFVDDMRVSQSHYQHGKWPNTTIYYEFNNVPDDKKEILENTIEKINQNTCLQIVELPESPPSIDGWIEFRQGRWCSSRVGYKKGVNSITVKGCRPGMLIYHALNFDHIHNAENRQEYINVNLNNLKNPHNEQNYVKQNASNFDIRFDYASPLHFRNCLFAKDDPVITFKSCPSMNIDEDRDVSEWDYFKINRLYCPKWYYNNKI
ncbi:astacin-like metalloprotease toxin 1 [Scaptodrosophila lebanonensis]|uniref:Metalloendopeptidase n=1 Tax=Drosophila lebanonensis TaxID=7225 RepID=A0A6J2TRV8_DROLE|nr:astacin-like metalloprotease toxin 1 [Scaptodrosophila lebanonensis]